MPRKTEHVLSNIDVEARKANCVLCGPCRVREKNCRWRCKADRRVNKGGEGSGYRKYKGPICERCKFMPEHPCQLDVHHIDENHENNDPANLQTLCANCHRLATFT